MITKELQQLSDKLVGSHTSAHEISKQVDYIEKNYEGGGSGGGGALRVNYTEEGTLWTLDHTYAEIRDAYFNGQNVYLYKPAVGEDWEIDSLIGISRTGGYNVRFYNDTNVYQFSSQTSDGYPTLNWD